MFQDLKVFKTAFALATHAGARQSVVAGNLANADTPGYRARDVTPFSDAYGDESGSTQMRTTRAGHLGSDLVERTWPTYFPDTPADPDGNSVSIEEEMLKAVEVKRQYDRAIAIYRSGLNVLRTSIGRI